MADIRQWLNQTIYWAHKIGEDPFTGDPTYSVPVAAPARVRNLQRLIQDRNGQEVVAAFEIVTEAPVELDDRIWLPGESPTGSNPDVGHQPKNRETVADTWGRSRLTRVWI